MWRDVIKMEYVRRSKPTTGARGDLRGRTITAFSTGLHVLEMSYGQWEFLHWLHNHSLLKNDAVPWSRPVCQLSDDQECFVRSRACHVISDDRRELD
jgi:hypothetical protein